MQLRICGIDLDNIEAELETLNLDDQRIVIMRSDEDSPVLLASFEDLIRAPQALDD